MTSLRSSWWNGFCWGVAVAGGLLGIAIFLAWDTWCP